MKTSLEYDADYAQKINNILHNLTMEQQAMIDSCDNTLFNLFFPCHFQLFLFTIEYEKKDNTLMKLYKLEIGFLKELNLTSEDIWFILATAITFTNFMLEKNGKTYTITPYHYDEETDSHYVTIVTKSETSSLDLNP